MVECEQVIPTLNITGRHGTSLRVNLGFRRKTKEIFNLRESNNRAVGQCSRSGKGPGAIVSGRQGSILQLTTKIERVARHFITAAAINSNVAAFTEVGQLDIVVAFIAAYFIAMACHDRVIANAATDGVVTCSAN